MGMWINEDSDYTIMTTPCFPVHHSLWLLLAFVWCHTYRSKLYYHHHVLKLSLPYQECSFYLKVGFCSWILNTVTPECQVAIYNSVLYLFLSLPCFMFFVSRKGLSGDLGSRLITSRNFTTLVAETPAIQYPTPLVLADDAPSTVEKGKSQIVVSNFS